LVHPIGQHALYNLAQMLDALGCDLFLKSEVFMSCANDYAAVITDALPGLLKELDIELVVLLSRQCC
jgi:hypothetical protein